MSSTNYQDDDTQEETWETGEMFNWLNSDEYLYFSARRATGPGSGTWAQKGVALKERFEGASFVGKNFDFDEVDWEQIARDLWDADRS